jgi:hypothetical protein
MKALAGMPGTVGMAATNLANGTGIVTTNWDSDPDPRQMAPFEVGDFITWQGTLKNDGTIWVHTLEANVGIYTQPATLPAYIAIGDNGIGIDPLPAAAVALVGVEATPRIFAEAVTTDIASIVDFYLDDKGFKLNPNVVVGATTPPDPFLDPDTVVATATTPTSEYFRWITPESMTGTVADQTLQAAKLVAPAKIPPSSVAQANAFGGGIYTQYIGPQPGRARIRANKVPAIDPAGTCNGIGSGTPGSVYGSGCAITQSPTRYIRAVLRSLCAPAASFTDAAQTISTPSTRSGFPNVPATNLNDSKFPAPNTGPFYDINGTRAPLPDAGAETLTLKNKAGTNAPVAVNFDGGPKPPTGSTAPTPHVDVSDNSCLQSAQYANGLFTGQYMAPVGEFIFPENTLAGFAVLPNDFWHMGFLLYGEKNADTLNSTAQQFPRPW